MEKNSFEKIYDVIRQIPRGQVASYGQIAALAGNRRWARVVGYALHAVPCNSDLPCHRVVTKDGRMSCAFGDGRRMYSDKAHINYFSHLLVFPAAQDKKAFHALCPVRPEI